MSNDKAFTIIELVVTIAVIGILVMIVNVSFAAVTRRAEESRLTGDLLDAKNDLLKAKAEYGAFPSTIDCGQANSKTNWCVEPSADVTLNYTKINSMAFHLKATKGNYSYSINDGTAPAIATTAYGSSVGQSCPNGFIPVPGSGTYRTNDFCVMKYEAKNVGGIPTSQPALAPWISISQNTAITTAQTACTNCHLISEAEWMTIVQNALSVTTNWNGGVIGTSYVFCGHNDTNPNSALAVSNVNDGYSDTGNSSPSNQRRTLILTNGEVIWDLSGNVWEWTSGTVQSPSVQPGITGAGMGYRSWPSITNPGTITPNPSVANTGFIGANSWGTANGMGSVNSNSDETVLKGFLRGTDWDHADGGLASLDLNSIPTVSTTHIGFRAAR